MSIFPLIFEDFLFLAVSIFRHAIFGSGLLVVQTHLRYFLFFRETAIFGHVYFWQCLFLAGVVTMLGDMWQSLEMTCGRFVEHLDELALGWMNES
jgi:hypothetical protein